MKNYYKPAPGDEHIHVCKIRTLVIAAALIISAGVLVAFLQGAA